MKILVTGGAGFIGSHVVDRYVSLGHDVTVVDNFCTGKKENLNSRARFHHADIREMRDMEKLFREERFDLVNHHAALMSVPLSVNDPVFVASNNINGFLNVLELSVRYSVKKVVFISSGGTVYGDVKEYPTTEQCHPEPYSPYAITKYTAEKYLQYYNHHYGIDYSILRYGNVYGPRQTPHAEAGVVSIFMTRLLRGEQCTVYAFADAPAGMERDYVYIDDVADVNELILMKGSSETYNVGTGAGTTTLDLFTMIYDVLNNMVQIPDHLRHPITDKERPGDLRRNCLDIRKIREQLGWAPRTSLVEGLRKTATWQIQEFQRSRE